MQKFSLTLSDDFIAYCKLNEIQDPVKKAQQLFDKAFTLEKYGDKPIVAVHIPHPLPTTPTYQKPEPLMVNKNQPPEKDLYGD